MLLAVVVTAQSQTGTILPENDKCGYHINKGEKVLLSIPVNCNTWEIDTHQPMVILDSMIAIKVILIERQQLAEALQKSEADFDLLSAAYRTMYTDFDTLIQKHNRLVERFNTLLVQYDKVTK